MDKERIIKEGRQLFWNLMVGGAPREVITDVMCRKYYLVPVEVDRLFHFRRTEKEINTFYKTLKKREPVSHERYLEKQKLVINADMER